MENSFVDTKLRSLTELLTSAQGQLDAALKMDRQDESIADNLTCASGNLKAARLRIDEISDRIEAETKAAPKLRDCPACGKSVRLEATLCGHCWKKLPDPGSSSR